MNVYSIPALLLFEDGNIGKSGEATPVRFEEEIRRSRFITTLAHTDSRERVLAFVECIRREFPDATHHCWAYNAGPPGDTARVGQSDDGEPHGTAGRPMLNQLLHSGVGEIAAVTARYFGGVKLGTGGLTRAYQNGVKEALALLPTVEKSVLCRAIAGVDYPHLDRFYRLLSRFQARVSEENFGERALFTIECPEESFNTFKLAFRELTDGFGELSRLERDGSNF